MKSLNQAKAEAEQQLLCFTATFQQQGITDSVNKKLSDAVDAIAQYTIVLASHNAAQAGGVIIDAADNPHG